MAECLRNLVCAGATPLAMTDNLNFGNPYKPENFYQLKECVAGLAEACRFFDVPVVGRQRLALQRVARGRDRPDADGLGGRPHRERGAHHPPVRRAAGDG
jgi:phosphoribosylaminoimidazole (AIR) synthetase